MDTHLRSCFEDMTNRCWVWQSCCSTTAAVWVLEREIFTLQ